MLKLSDFDRVDGQRQTKGMVTQCYFKTITQINGRLGLYLKLSERFTKEFTQTIGHRCITYVSKDFKQVVLAYGDSKTVSTQGKAKTSVIQFNTIAEQFQERYGKVSRFFFDGKWETDENGNKVLLLVHNGKVEK